MDNNTSTPIAIFVSALVGLILGAFGGYYFHHPAATPTTVSQLLHQPGLTGTATLAADERVRWRVLLSQDAELSSETMRSILDGRTDTSDLQAAWQGQIHVMTDHFGTIYAPSAEGEFLGWWQKQIGLLSDYATAIKAHNASGAATAKTGLSETAAGLGAFLHSVSPTVSSQGATSSLGGIFNGLMSSVDATAAGKPANAIANEQKAVESAGSLADALASGIVTQFPAKF